MVNVTENRMSELNLLLIRQGKNNLRIRRHLYDLVLWPLMLHSLM